MKHKNLNIRKVFFALGMSFVLTGCGSEEKALEEMKIEFEQSQLDDTIKIESENSDIIQTMESQQSEYENSIIIENEFIVDTTLDYKDNSYTVTDLNLRDDNSLDGNIITVVDKCQKIANIIDTGEWSYIEYDGIFGYVNNKYIKELPTNYIEVDISEQNIVYHIDNQILVDSDIVTGHKGINDTRIGMFEIYSRETSRYLTGRDKEGNITYRSYVDYWMPFDGGIGLHDAQWRSEFGGDIYINSGSHGCVNLPFEVAKTIYENSEVGTKVLVHK